MTTDDMIRQTQAVTLEKMLAAREERAEEQQRMLAANPGCALISFTLNIPGQYKAYPLAVRGFNLGRDLVRRQLRRQNMAIESSLKRELSTGYEQFFAVSAPGELVKNTCVSIEECHPLGRLFDIDVFGTDGVGLRGGDQGRGERTCVVCGGPVWECARSRAHPADQLARKVGQMLRDYFEGGLADAVAAQATRALMYEVATTPKPGLVDRTNTGAHRDMTVFTFIDSSVTLTPFFREMVCIGLGWEGDPGSLLPRLRLPGMWTEDAMFSATNGVNTHKGLIFSLGLMCASVGLAAGRGMRVDDAETILAFCGSIAAETPMELMRQMPDKNPTHGENAFARFGLTGARGEAARGFPDVRDCALPVLRRWLDAGASHNDAGVAALIALMSRVDDTNIVTRSDLDTLREVQTRAAAIMRRCGDDLPALIREAADLDVEFIIRCLSAGGCADLLALAFMLTFLERETCFRD